MDPAGRCRCRCRRRFGAALRCGGTGPAPPRLRPRPPRVTGDRPPPRPALRDGAALKRKGPRWGPPAVLGAAQPAAGALAVPAAGSTALSPVGRRISGRATPPGHQHP